MMNYNPDQPVKFTN